MANERTPIPQLNETPMTSAYSVPLDLLCQPPRDAKLTAIEAHLLEQRIKLVLQKLRIPSQILYSEADTGRIIFEIVFEKSSSSAVVAFLCDQLERELLQIHFYTKFVDMDLDSVRLMIRVKERTSVYMREVVEKGDFYSEDMILPIAIGKISNGAVCLRDIAKLRHLLIGGMAGSGKSCFLHTLILSLLMRQPPEALSLIMVDMTESEFYLYKGIPHLLAPIITTSESAICELKKLRDEMLRRLSMVATQRSCSSEACNVSSMQNELPQLPRIVFVADEFSGLMISHSYEAEKLICQIAQMGHTVGIHLVLSSQAETVNIFTGAMRRVFPSRALFRVTSSITACMMGCPGAEILQGCGNMLLLSAPDNNPICVKGCYASFDEIKRAVGFLKHQYNTNIDFTQE